MHRDLNPENVMIDARGHIVLTNFRCAKLSDPKDFRHHRRIVSAGGNKEYQAPEMLLDWTHDFSVDCWGFGILLYFMLFGTVGCFDLFVLKELDVDGDIFSLLLGI